MSVVVEFANMEVVYHLLTVARECMIVGETANLHTSAMASLRTAEEGATLVKRLHEDFIRANNEAKVPVAGSVVGVPDPRKEESPIKAEKSK